MPKTWKEIKQAYLLTLIKHGDLSRGHLDSLIGEAQRMTSDHGNMAAANIDDMARVVEAHGGDEAEMKTMLKQCFDVMRLMPCETLSSSVTIVELKELLAKLEGKQDGKV